MARHASVAHPGEGLRKEAGRSAGGVGGTTPEAVVQHVAGRRGHRKQRVVAADMAVGELRAPVLLQPVGLADRGVHVHDELAGSLLLGLRAGSRCIGPLKEMAGDDVELAYMAPGKRAQERAHRGGGPQLMAQHRLSVAGGQDADVVDVATPRQGGMHHGQGLVGDVAHAEVHVRREQPCQIEVLGQCGRQDQSGVGDKMLVVELHQQPVEAVRRSHRKGASLAGLMERSQTPLSLVRGHFSRLSRHYLDGCSVDQG